MLGGCINAADQRKEYGERCPGVLRREPGFEADGPSMVLNNSAGNPQTDPRAFLAFGCVEGIKNQRPIVQGDTGPLSEMMIRTPRRFGSFQSVASKMPI